MTHVFVDHDYKIVKGLQEIIFCNGLKGDTKQGEWVELWDVMQASKDPDYRSMLIRSLGCADDRVLLRTFLQTSIATNSDNNYTRSERVQIFNSVIESTAGLQAVVEFLENYERDGIQQM